LHLRLPPGYHAHLDPDVLVLGRADGSVVGRFNSPGLVAEEVEGAAWEDYGAAGRRPPRTMLPARATRGRSGRKSGSKVSRPAAGGLARRFSGLGATRSPGAWGCTSVWGLGVPSRPSPLFSRSQSPSNF
jgi:hypothetical protein